MKVFPSHILSCTLIGFWSCSDSGEPKIEGCMDSDACNYSIENTHDDDSCWSPTEGCTCANAEDAIVDECGVCGGSGPIDSNHNCDGNCIVATDICGTCGGAFENMEDCCEEGQIPDCANVCGGSGLINTDGDGECCVTGVIDCDNVCGGSSVIDDCSVCGGDNSTCVNFSTEIQPIFTTNQLCTSCHNVSFFTHVNLMSVVEVSDSTNSMLIRRLKGDGVLQMPKDKTPLEAQIITSIATWIQEGALDN